MSDNPQQLDSSLTLWPIVFFGLAYITPFIVLTTFGVFSEASNGTLPTAYAIAGIAMIFTALSYGKMAREFPLAGSAYTYARKASTRAWASWSAGQCSSTTSSCPWSCG